MRVISLTSATSVPDQATGESFDAGPDGVFDLPHEFALYLTTKHASQWRSEGEHESALRSARLEELRNPHLVAPTLLEHAGRIEQLEAKVEALLARRDSAADEQRAAETGDATPAETAQPRAAPQPAEPKPTRARKTAASGKARQTKTEDPATPDVDGARDEPPPA